MLLGAASQRVEILVLELLGTEWVQDMVREWKRKERGALFGLAEYGVIIYVISKIQFNQQHRFVHVKIRREYNMFGISINKLISCTIDTVPISPVHFEDQNNTLQSILHKYVPQKLFETHFSFC